MKHLQASLLTLAVAVALISLEAQRAQAGVPNPQSTNPTYLPLLFANYRVPPPVYPPINRIVYQRETYNQSLDTWFSTISVMNPDGTGKTALTDGSRFDSEPAWSPDGSKIAFISRVTLDAVPRVYVMNANGSGIRPLTDDVAPWFLHNHPTWSPYGDRIAFSKCEPLPSGDGLCYIFIVNADGSGAPVQITTDGAALHPDWSPDGNKILYDWSSRAGFYPVNVINSDGTGRTGLAWGQSPNWSPDGKKIAYTSWISDTSSGGLWQIFAMDADGSNQVPLTNYPTSTGPASPNWSPDGTRLAFTYWTWSAVDGTWRADIYIMNADGTGQTKITNSTESDRSLAPDWR